MKSRGAAISNVDFAYDNTSSRVHMLANTLIPRFAPIMSVPKECIFHYDIELTDPILIQARDTLVNVISMAFMIAAEKKNPLSTYKELIDTIATDISTFPAFYSKHELELINNTALACTLIY